MDAPLQDRLIEEGCCEVLAPEHQTLPIVFASPHSGRDYPPEFVAATRLDPLTLRNSEDSFVDELFAAAPSMGAPLLRALFPRAFIDPNREPFELDPAMFEDALPDYANVQSARVAAGLGTIARVVTNGAEIYKRKLQFSEAADRINAFYRPYHRTLKQLLDTTREKNEFYILIDCHSMPSVGGPMDPDAGRGRVDFVLGNCFGRSCANAVVENVERALKSQGHTVARNRPYAGGFTTRHYGRPAAGMHALQIEVNRALYMNEATIERSPDLPQIAKILAEVISALSEIDPAALKPG